MNLSVGRGSRRVTRFRFQTFISFLQGLSTRVAPTVGETFAAAGIAAVVALIQASPAIVAVAAAADSAALAARAATAVGAT